MNDTHETPEDDNNPGNADLDSDIAAQLQKIQAHLGFLEKKIDSLIELSQKRPSGGSGFGDSRPSFRPREFGGGGGFRSGGPRRDDRGHRGRPEGREPFRGAGRPEGREPFRGAGRPEGREPFRGAGRSEGRDSFRAPRSDDGNRGPRPDGNRGEARPFFKKAKRR